MNAMPPIAGEIVGRVVESTTISIHGDLYYDLVIEPASTATEAVRLRAPSHGCPRAPVPGERIVVSLLMGQVTALRFEE